METAPSDFCGSPDKVCGTIKEMEIQRANMNSENCKCQSFQTNVIST